MMSNDSTAHSIIKKQINEKWATKLEVQNLQNLDIIP